MNTRNRVLIIIGAALLSAWSQSSRSAEESSLAGELQRARQRATQRAYPLRYRFQPGETCRWRVIHLTTVQTTVQGETEVAKTRAASTKVWQVQEVDDSGNITFQHSVSDVNMWQQVGDREELRYDSTDDLPPPPEYASVAQRVGVPLKTITISPHGQVISRGENEHVVNMGLGEIAIPFPEQPIEVGHRWYAPDEVLVRRPDRRVQRIKTRVEFTLDAVSAGIARISMKTQVLTPVNDPRIEAQLVKQLTAGTVRFDMDAGRIISRQTDWDETVIGFQGPDSLMKYLARFTEDMLPAEATARTVSSTSR
jgi:hypothetical protein